MWELNQTLLFSYSDETVEGNFVTKEFGGVTAAFEDLMTAVDPGETLACPAPPGDSQVKDLG